MPQGYKQFCNAGQFCNDKAIQNRNDAGKYTSEQDCEDDCSADPKCQFYKYIDTENPHRCQMWHTCYSVGTASDKSGKIQQRPTTPLTDTTPEQCNSANDHWGSETSLCYAATACKCSAYDSTNDKACSPLDLGECSTNSDCFWSPMHYPACWAQVRNAMGYKLDAAGFANWLVVNYFNCQSGLFMDTSVCGSTQAKQAFTIMSVKGDNLTLKTEFSAVFDSDDATGAVTRLKWDDFRPDNLPTQLTVAIDATVTSLDLSPCSNNDVSSGPPTDDHYPYQQNVTSFYNVNSTQANLEPDAFPNVAAASKGVTWQWNGDQNPGPNGKLSLPVLGFMVTFVGNEPGGKTNRYCNAFYMAENPVFNIDGVPGGGSSTTLDSFVNVDRNKKLLQKFISEYHTTDCCLSAAQSNPLCDAVQITQSSAICDTAIGQICSSGGVPSKDSLCYCLGDGVVQPTLNDNNDPYVALWNGWPRGSNHVPLPSKGCILSTCMNRSNGNSYIPTSIGDTCPSLCINFAEVKGSNSLAHITQNATCSNSGGIDLDPSGSSPPSGDSPLSGNSSPSKPAGTTKPFATKYIVIIIVVVVCLIALAGVVIHAGLRRNRKLLKTEMSDMQDAMGDDDDDDS